MIQIYFNGYVIQTTHVHSLSAMPSHVCKYYGVFVVLLVFFSSLSLPLCFFAFSLLIFAFLGICMVTFSHSSIVYYFAFLHKTNFSHFHAANEIKRKGHISDYVDTIPFQPIFIVQFGPLDFMLRICVATGVEWSGVVRFCASCINHVVFIAIFGY